MFIGRDFEIKELNKLYNTDKFQCIIVYGRRRVGKTRLIQEFIKDKKAIYFASMITSSKQNLLNFKREVLNVFDDVLEIGLNFEDWYDSFDYIYKKSLNERLILVIDEYPYLAKSEGMISSLLQTKIDRFLVDTKLFLILCGSSMSFMEYQVLGYKSPLYGRRTAQLKMKNIDFFDSMKFHNNFNKFDQAVIYGLTGGTPQYLNLINDDKTIRENIIDCFLNTTSFLYEEPINLIMQELDEPNVHNGIITAIANGASKLNEISTKVDIDSKKCSTYINSLISIGLVKREVPIYDNDNKRAIFVLKDNLFKFWYRFIPDNISNIEANDSKSIYENSIEPYLSDYMGGIFEDICIEYMMRKLVTEELPFKFGNIGRWWGNNKIKMRQEEIDILAIDANKTKAIFGECKWRNEPVSIDVIKSLMEKGDLFPQFKQKYYFFFSKSGFDEKAMEMEKENNLIKLISFEDMII